jgi:cation transport ATPase
VVNDALSLSKAQEGVGIGAGRAKAAIAAGDFALDRQRSLASLILQAPEPKKTLGVIEQNCWLAALRRPESPALRKGWRD